LIYDIIREICKELDEEEIIKIEEDPEYFVK
jgi:hypothetical protein